MFNKKASVQFNQNNSNWCLFSQGLYLDTAAYEHIVESVCAKAQELVLSSPACKVSSSSDLLVKRYNIIRGVARVSQNSVPVTHWTH